MTVDHGAPELAYQQLAAILRARIARVSGATAGADPDGQFEGLRRPPEWGTDLASQVEALRKQGSHIEVITPDADSRAAMGTNQMDPASRIPAARAGFAQGKQEATRMTFP